MALDLLEAAVVEKPLFLIVDWIVSSREGSVWLGSGGTCPDEVFQEGLPSWELSWKNYG